MWKSPVFYFVNRFSLNIDFMELHAFPYLLYFTNKWVSETCSVVSYSLWPHGLYSPWNSPGQNTRVGSLSLLQGIFPTQGPNPGLLHCRWILYQLSHKRSPRILEWIAYPFSRGSFQPRNQTEVSCTVGGFFTNENVEILVRESIFSNNNCLSLYRRMSKGIH